MTRQLLPSRLAAFHEVLDDAIYRRRRRERDSAAVGASVVPASRIHILFAVKIPPTARRGGELADLRPYSPFKSRVTYLRPPRHCSAPCQRSLCTRGT